MSQPIFTLSENDTVKTWNRNSEAMLAAIAVYREAYNRNPVYADTYATVKKAELAARKAGAGHPDSLRLAIVAWDFFSKEIQQIH